MNTATLTTLATPSLTGARQPLRAFNARSRVGPAGIAIMVGLHLLVAFLLLSGLGQQVVVKRDVAPQKAIDDGIAGVVKAELRIRAGKVVEVRILSGPKPYHLAVHTAVAQYECISSGPEEELARQEFEFKAE